VPKSSKLSSHSGAPVLMKMRHLLVFVPCILILMGHPVCGAQSRSLDKELFQAVAKGDLGAVRVLLENGASIDAHDDGRGTPLMVAVGSHNIAMVKLLLEKGANISVRDKYEETALTEAVRSFDSNMLRTLLEGNPDINDKNAALLQAAGDGPVVIQTVGASLNPNGPRDHAATAPLEQPWVTNVRLLLDSGANLEARDEEGSTPLMRAASYGQTETFKLLIERGAKISVRDKRGMTPLIAAACACAIATMNGTYDILKILMEKGANVNAWDKDGRTALMLAASSPDDPSSVELLLNNGANPFVKDKRGYTALTFALKGTRSEKAPLLRGAMAKAR